MKLKRVMGILLALIMVISLAAGCGKTETTKEVNTSNGAVKDGDEKSGSVSKSGDSNEADSEIVELVLAVDDLSDASWYDAMESAWYEENPNIRLTYVETPEFTTKIPISIAAGDTIDVVRATNPIILRQWADAGIFTNLNDFNAANGVDVAEWYGTLYDQNYAIDGVHYVLPQSKSIWALYYNKAIFDGAGIPYPDEQMTWDEFAELAKQLTYGEGVDKVSGAYSLQWPMYYYASAIQTLGGGEQFYNAEGMSNIEAPEFAAAMERVYKMMHEDKSMPTYAEFTTEKLGWDGFLSGNYGMHMHGSWAFSAFFKNPENYPRDWKFGVTRLPVPNEGDDPTSFGVYEGFGIGTTSKHPEEAYKFIKFLAERFPEFTDGTIPAYQLGDMTNLAVRIAEGLEDDGVTADMIKHAILSPEISVLTEKITGTGATMYDTIYIEEVEMYLVQAQDVDTTIANIKSRADQMIEELLNE